MRRSSSGVVALVFSGVVLMTSGCAPELMALPKGELERPQRVLVVTIDREPSSSSSWRPGLSLGLGFGSFGSHLGGGIDFSHESGGPASALRDQLKKWDFRTQLQRLFLSKSPPGAWTWIDGDTADPNVADQIDRMYDDREASAPLLPAYAAKYQIDKVLVVDPILWGLKGDEGLMVELRGRLFEPTEKRQLVWEGRGHPAQGRRPFFEAGAASVRDQEAIHRALLDSAAESCDDLIGLLESASQAPSPR